MTKKQSITYAYNDTSHLGLFRFLLILWEQIIDNKIHIVASIKNEFIEKYYTTGLGLLWAVIIPIVPMTAYMMLVYIKAFNSSSDIPYIFYISVGITIWMLMSKIMRQSMMAIVYQRNLLAKTNLPIIAAVFASLGEVIFDTLVRFLAILTILVIFGISLNLAGCIQALFVLLLLILFSISVGLLLSITNVIIPDTIKIFDIAMRYGIFLSSVIFPFPNEGLLGIINAFNPFNTFINAFRNLLYFGEVTQFGLLVVTSLLTLLSVWISAKLIVFMNIRVKAYL